MPTAPVICVFLRDDRLLLGDEVLFHQATISVGSAGLKALAAEYAAKGRHFEAAKAHMSLLNLSTRATGDDQAVIIQTGLAQLEQIGPSKTRESMQLVCSQHGRHVPLIYMR